MKYRSSILDYHNTDHFLIQTRHCIPDHLQSSLRARFDHALEWYGMPSETRKELINLSKWFRPRHQNACDVPDMRFIELGFDLLADRCFDIEHGEGTSDVKEQGPESEPPSWTHPVKGSPVKSYRRF